jgi:hypothetical protein
MTTPGAPFQRWILFLAVPVGGLFLVFLLLLGHRTAKSARHPAGHFEARVLVSPSSAHPLDLLRTALGLGADVSVELVDVDSRRRFGRTVITRMEDCVEDALAVEITWKPGGVEFRSRRDEIVRLDFPR